ncbi:MAG: hypothetical protein HQK53_03745 [Oligoflexia bacterium]|nr:hypothetical protein [Oligoflexia bacterium]
MVRDKGIALLILAFFMGTAIGLGMISAQAYLLSELQAIHSIYVGIITGFMLFPFFHYLPPKKMKFASFSVILTIIFIVPLILVDLRLVDDKINSFMFLILAILGYSIFGWITFELTSRYLAPPRAQAYFSYISSFSELGLICPLVVIKIMKIELSLSQNIYIIITCYLIILFLLLLLFVPKKNIEIKYTKKCEDPVEILPDFAKKMKYIFILFCLCLGSFKIIESYVVKAALKFNLSSFELIDNMISQYYLITSITIFFFSIFLGKVIENKRVSPSTLLMIQALLLTPIIIACIIFENFYLIILLEIIRRAVEVGLYSPSSKMILSAFQGKLRSQFLSIHTFYYYTFMSTPMVILFYFTKELPYLREQHLLLYLCIASLLMSLFATKQLIKNFISLMYTYIHSGAKTASIIAVNMLSFLRPNNYTIQMSNLLTSSPKKILRKDIILGLAYVKNELSLKTIIDEFNSDHETIQMAVVDALHISRSYSAINFLMNIINAKVRPRTLRVRINAMMVIAGLYGKKAIPFLLNGLRDHDLRIIANTLETLCIFKEKELIPYFKEFSTSDNPRIKANALMGLSAFRKTKKYYLQTIDAILEGSDEKMISSMLYVVGKKKQTQFKSSLHKIYKNVELISNFQVKRTLAWALIMINDEKGFQLSAELLVGDGKSASPGEAQVESFMHFVSQLPQVIRFDLLKYIAVEHIQKDRAVSLEKLGNILKKSTFDFHEELDYLGFLIHTSPITQKGP